MTRTFRTSAGTFLKWQRPRCQGGKQESALLEADEEHILPTVAVGCQLPVLPWLSALLTIPFISMKALMTGSLVIRRVALPEGITPRPKNGQKVGSLCSALNQHQPGGCDVSSKERQTGIGEAFAGVPISLPFAEGLTLIPKPMLQRYVSLLTDHRRIILSGPSGTGKTYLANRLAEHMVLREGRELTDGVIATFNVDHKSSK
eukprot:g32820.t1